ncbi:hypothetical protein [Cellulosimicrobium sp. 22601]|uniref:hypothetical protein n=1 Tax=unclassified Cellulosimicrobium TaxID=2624466 RepID=UPI003F854EA7
MASEITHGDAGPSRKAYQRGCGCPACRAENARYVAERREEKRRAQLPEEIPERPPVVVHVPADEPDEPGPAGPIEQALADDLARDDGKPEFLRAVATTVARSLDGAVKQHRHDLVSPLAQRLVDIGTRLFPPKPEGGGELTEEEKRAKVLELIRGDGEDGAASGS